MNTHIVRVGDKIEKIALIYNLSEDEIIKINHHINDWSNLIPGTKLRLPEIPEIVNDELDNTEPFIEEYYPRIDATIYNKTYEKEEINVENIEEVKPQTNKKSTISKSFKYNPYLSYYYNPYNNYYNYVRNKQKAKEKK